MNLQHQLMQDSQHSQEYIFSGHGWPVGEGRSFEEDLSASEGNDEKDVTNCVKVIQQLQSNNERLEEIRPFCPRLCQRIFHEEPPELIPTPETGISAFSLRFVIKRLAGTVESPAGQDSQFLKTVTQICITLWMYQCDTSVFADLEQHVRGFILNREFTPRENDAAYLAIIAFVFGGALDMRLSEYFDAVVWHSATEFATAVSPLGKAIHREREALLELIFNGFSRLLNGLWLSGDDQLKNLAERLHQRLKTLTDSQLDFSLPFANFRHLSCARYPAILQDTFLKALRTELKVLKNRTQSFGSNHSDTAVPRVHYSRGTRYGGGKALVGYVVEKVTGKKKESSSTPETPADLLESLIEESKRVIAEHRLRMVVAVHELLRERDAGLDARSSAGEESYLYAGSGSIGGYSS